MQAAVEISLYPLDAAYIEPIKAFIAKLNARPGLKVETNAMSTQVFGSLDHVLRVIGEEIEASALNGPRQVFVMKVIPGLVPHR